MLKFSDFPHILYNPGDNVLKIVLFENKTIKVKYNINGEIINVLYDLKNARRGIFYQGHSARGTYIDYWERDLYNQLRLDLKFGTHGGGHIDYYPPRNTTFPMYLYLGADQTETDETPDRTIHFPPQETVEQFFERVWAKLLHLTRRIRILRHEEPHQNALSEKICREVPENHDEVLRYDIACNLIKRPCGWLALQLENYQARYNRHLAAVVTAKEAGRTPPNFQSWHR